MVYWLDRKFARTKFLVIRRNTLRIYKNRTCK